jgi:hypothetical protein
MLVSVICETNFLDVFWLGAMYNVDYVGRKEISIKLPISFLLQAPQ